MTAEEAITKSRETGQPVRIPHDPNVRRDLYSRAEDCDIYSNGVEVYCGEGWIVEVEPRR